MAVSAVVRHTSASVASVAVVTCGRSSWVLAHGGGELGVILISLTRLRSWAGAAFRRNPGAGAAFTRFPGTTSRFESGSTWKNGVGSAFRRKAYSVSTGERGASAAGLMVHSFGCASLELQAGRVPVEMQGHALGGASAPHQKESRGFGLRGTKHLPPPGGGRAGKPVWVMQLLRESPGFGRRGSASFATASRFGGTRAAISFDFSKPTRPRSGV